jgi:CBS domain-containing protein
MSSTQRMPTISEIMTSRVHTAKPDQSLGEIWQILVDEHCHHVPIVEGRRPIGMISTRDLIRVARQHGSQKIADAVYGDQTAREIMHAGVETIGAGASVEFAIDRIGIGDIHALVVVDDEDEIVGIVTNHDLLDYLIS